MARSLCVAPVVALATPTLSSSFPLSTDSNANRRLYQVRIEAVQLPIVRASLASVKQKDSIVSNRSSTDFPHQFQSCYTSQPAGHIYHQPTGSLDSLALIDIEEVGDGAVSFTFGAVEDLWHLDKLLEQLSSGVLTNETMDSYLSLVTELFKIPVSVRGQRRIADLFSEYACLKQNLSSTELQKTVIQTLAEAASEFLPPPNVGSYSRGGSRPSQRFSSSLDKCRNKVDNNLGVGEGVDFLQAPSLYYRSDDRTQADFKEWSKLASAETSRRQSYRDYVTMRIRRPLGFTLDKQNDSLPEVSEIDYIIEGQGFVYFSNFGSQMNTQEDIQVESGEDITAQSATDFTPMKTIEPLPTLSIQDMVQWEQEEISGPMAVSLPSKQVFEKKTTTRIKAKPSHRFRGNTKSTKSVSKNRSAPERGNDSKFWDILFGLPVSHEHSGVANFLLLRSSYSKEMSGVLNQVAVGLSGAGLALTLQVVAKMLSVNFKYDISKLLGIFRGVGLLWLSAAVQSLRKRMLDLPPECGTSSSKHKEHLFCLQQALRGLSFRTLTVVILIVISYGV